MYKAKKVGLLFAFMTTARLPAEWEKQSAALLTWPHQHSDWSATLTAIQPTYIALAQAISQRQKLLITCWDEQHQKQIKKQLKHCNAKNIYYFNVPTNDTWVRDNGPIGIFCELAQPHLLDFQFNSWGNKYKSDLDNALTTSLHHLHAFANTPVIKMPMVLEGGSIDVNGTGTLLTTCRCLLASSRNPTLSQTDIQNQLTKTLGINQFLWLKHGYLAGDDTDSHIDILARFCGEETLCFIHCEDATDEHFTELSLMKKELEAFRTRSGQPYQLHALPLPAAKYNKNGERLATSYANFFIINTAVLVPVYDDPQDEQAINILKTCFPEREIIPIPSLDLIQQGGSIHCATLQLPDGVL